MIQQFLSKCVNIQCGEQRFFIPCASKLLRKTIKKGGESRLFKFTFERTPSLRQLADVQRSVDPMWDGYSLFEMPQGGPSLQSDLFLVFGKFGNNGRVR